MQQNFFCILSDPTGPVHTSEEPDFRNAEDLRFFDLQRYPSDPSGMQLQPPEQDHHCPSLGSKFVIPLPSLCVDRRQSFQS